MAKYLTNTGKEIIRAMYYQVQAKKQKLREDNANIGSYEYQAIQQREIALDTLFTELITFPSSKIVDEDTTTYYAYLAKKHEKFSFDTDYNEEPLTVEGKTKVLSLYQDELVAIAAAWHDSIFTNLPHLDDVADIKHCTVNYNYLERQQGFRVALSELKVPVKQIRKVEEKIRNGVYTLTYCEKGNKYKKLAEYKE